MKILFTQKNILSTMVLMFISLATTSCNKKIMFQNSAVVPAAKGYVKVSKDHNNNYVVSVTITDLAEVKRLQPPKQTYIVWLVSNEQNTKNIGQIISNSSTLSSRLKANFETTSSVKPTKIFITAEDDKSVEIYGNQIVLTTDKF